MKLGNEEKFTVLGRAFQTLTTLSAKKFLGFRFQKMEVDEKNDRTNSKFRTGK